MYSQSLLGSMESDQVDYRLIRPPNHTKKFQLHPSDHHEQTCTKNLHSQRSNFQTIESRLGHHYHKLIRKHQRRIHSP